METKLLQADITTVAVDAIVNAANTSLLGGGGVDGAIHRKGGASILEDCIKIRARQGGCATGEAVITTAGNLPAKHVIHTVGPVWNGDKSQKAALLANCYTACLNLAVGHGLKTIAFPNISTGIYRFPKKRAAEIAIQTIRDFPQPEKLERVVLVCFDKENYTIYQALLEPSGS